MENPRLAKDQIVAIPTVVRKLIRIPRRSHHSASLELTRFRGHFPMLVEREVHDAPQSRRIPAGI
jgi:hypothetical protein